MKSHSKVYLLFAGEDEWKEGGARDLEGVYLTERQARTAFSDRKNDWDWAHILLVDGLQSRIVSTWRESWGWRSKT